MSTARDVKYYLKNKPYIQEALEKNIANISALARTIQEELKIESFEATKAALRRISQEMIKSKINREKRVLDLLKKSKITIYDNSIVLVSGEPLEIKEGIKVELRNQFIYLAGENELEKFGSKIIKINKNCTTILIKSPKEIENVPGVVAFLTSVIAEQNINVVEFISCWSDTIIVIDRKDSLKAYEILSSIIG